MRLLSSAAGASMAVALQIILITVAVFHSSPATATWCVVRSDASDRDLQMALEYACSAGAECAPIQPAGVCFLPNTVQAHASYAFNSYYQRRGNAAGSCSFGGIAAVAKTDPSYGSCLYPSSPSNAGTAMPGDIASTGTTVGLPSPAGPSVPVSGTPTYGNRGGGGGGGVLGLTSSVPIPPTSGGSINIKAIEVAMFNVIFSYILQTM